MPGSTRRSRAVDDLAAAHPRETAAVRGIGLSGQMHGATLLGADGRPLRPAILWNDGRSHAECAELERRCPSLHAIAGNLAMPGFTAPKLLWVARHEPEVFARRGQGASAQGLCPLPADRRDGRGHVGRGRNALARRRPARLVRDGPAKRRGSISTICRDSSRAAT